ncbi:MAG TPA: YceI family protein [Gallionella sp.]|nr:YceI family protein [Gallionella sp.]
MKYLAKYILLTICLLSTSINAIAAPRTLLRSASRIEFAIKEMGVPATGEFSRVEARLNMDPARMEASGAELRIDTGSLITGNNECNLGDIVNNDILAKTLLTLAANEPRAPPSQTKNQ